MKWNKFIIVLCLGVILQSTTISAEIPSNKTYEIDYKQSGNIVYLGKFKEYTVNLESEDMYITREGSKARPIKNGETIRNYGEYTIALKDKNKLIRFSIDNECIDLVKNYEDLYEVAYRAIHNNEKAVEFRVDKVYLENIKPDIYSMASYVNDENPLLMATTHKILTLGDKITLEFKNSKAEEYKETTEKVKKELDEFIGQLDLSKSDLEIELEVIDWLTVRAKYKDGEILADDIAHSIQSLATGNELVCDGYAKTFMYILNNVGIPTEMISGWANSGRHAWNLVEINGEIYHVDITWADTAADKKLEYYDYVNENDSYMQKSHRWDVYKYPKAEGTTYLNTNCFKFITPDEVDKSNLNRPILIKNTERNVIEKSIKDIANKVGRIYYLAYSKYGNTIIVINEKKG